MAKIARTSGRYENMVSTIRRLRNDGTRCEVEAMSLVLELERLPNLWKDKKAPTFHDLVKLERFCTVSRWLAFKRAQEHFGRRFPLMARQLGVDAICLIARQPLKRFDDLTAKALAFRTDHKIAPTYQYITQIIGRDTSKKKPTPRASLLRKIAALENNVKTLKQTLSENNIKLPALEAT